MIALMIILRSLTFCDGKTEIALCPNDYYSAEGYDVMKHMVALHVESKIAVQFHVSERFAVSEYRDIMSYCWWIITMFHLGCKCIFFNEEQGVIKHRPEVQMYFGLVYMIKSHIIYQIYFGYTIN